MINKFSKHDLKNHVFYINFKEITIPSGVTSIGDEAFGSSESPVTTIYYKGTATGETWGAKEVIKNF